MKAKDYLNQTPKPVSNEELKSIIKDADEKQKLKDRESYLNSLPMTRDQVVKLIREEMEKEFFQRGL